MARLFPPSRNLKQFTYSSNSTLVVPAHVNLISSVVGKGADGTPYTWVTQTLTMAQSSKSAVGGGSSVVPRSACFDYGMSQAVLFDWTGGPDIRAVTYTSRTYVTNTSDLTSVSTNSPVTVTVKSTGTTSYVTSTGNFTYANAGTDYVRVSIQVNTGGTSGAAATAFGYTFPGGVNGPATNTTVSNITVTPGGSYPITIPVGGGLIIVTYYE